MPATVSGGRRLEFAAPKPEKWLLDNGLTVLHLPIRQASLVSTVVSYRVGAASEHPEIGGAAHFLEHMMFKGSSRFGPGEIDNFTQIRGGWNNAYTSHDSTVYFFGFASDRWEGALAIEADRMRGLTLDPDQIDSERKVVREEISMYLDDPWDSLELEVYRGLFGTHPYGRPILGTPESLARLDGPALGRFHAEHYRPQNAVLTIAGDVSRVEVERAVEEHFGAIPSRPTNVHEAPEDEARLSTTIRIERRKGETARLLLALPAPRATDADHARLVVAMAVLGSGRASRLHQRMVEDLRLCSRISAEVTESVAPGVSMIAAEAMPEADPQRIEREVLEVLRSLSTEPPSQQEMNRARSVLAADWVFAHERIHQQAILVGTAETLFSADYPGDHLRAVRECSGEELLDVAERYLRPANGSVAGWSLPGESNDS